MSVANTGRDDLWMLENGVKRPLPKTKSLARGKPQYVEMLFIKPKALLNENIRAIELVQIWHSLVRVLLLQNLQSALLTPCD